MYIKHLELKNFQRHKHLSVDLTPGINAIVGESDQGKSAVIRAIRWVFTNRPEGHQMRRATIKDGKVSLSKETVVTITLDNDIQISRVRSKRANRYILNRPGEDPQNFDNFGRVIPEPIKEALGNILAHLDYASPIELSIATQHEGPFLLNQSGQSRAEILGKISKTSILDAAVKELAAEVRTNGKHILSLDRAKEEVEQKLTGYEELNKRFAQLKTIEQKLELLDDLKAEWGRGVAIGKRLAELDAIITKEEEEFKSISSIPSEDEFEVLGTRLHKGTLILERAIKLGESTRGTIQEMEQIDALSPDIIGEFDEASHEFQRAKSVWDRVENWKKELKANSEEYNALDGKITNLVNIFVDIVQRERICPTCTSPINEEAIDRITNDLKG